MLAIENLSVHYGYVHALRSVSLRVKPGSIVALLGANGAGKSTTLRAISRQVQPKEGTIQFAGESLLRQSASDVVKKGIIHCPENRRIFPKFTVEENLQIGAYTRRDDEVKADFEKVFRYFPRLKERLRQIAGTLSGGEQQMLAIGRSLMAKPQLLLLDEPSLGLAPNIVRDIFGIIKRINDEGTAILLVEQNAHKALEISDYAYVLENGRIELEGNSDQLKQNEQIKRLYLGG
ncbi:ABC transporter ATP-binding protein [Brevibacillus sp. B_LB10_24]|uniref:ABC transporter ATP-binding protein n=1 Tax=Brevibacillus sp. B_LB10_24 TaxID=3380645 RepID=UPI0038B7A354